MIKETDIAWAAGIMDGEGTFTIARSKPRNGMVNYSYIARIRLGMCHRPTIERFAAILGGHIAEEKAPAKNSNWKMYRWTASGLTAVNSAKILLPYLVTKKHEAELLIQWEPLIADGRKTFVTTEMLAQREVLYQALITSKTSQLNPVGSQS